MKKRCGEKKSLNGKNCLYFWPVVKQRVLLWWVNFYFFNASINSLFNKFYLKQKWTRNSEFRFIAVLVHAISKHLCVCAFLLVSKLHKKKLHQLQTKPTESINKLIHSLKYNTKTNILLVTLNTLPTSLKAPPSATP